MKLEPLRVNQIRAFSFQALQARNWHNLRPTHVAIEETVHDITKIQTFFGNKESDVLLRLWSCCFVFGLVASSSVLLLHLWSCVIVAGHSKPPVAAIVGTMAPSKKPYQDAKAAKKAKNSNLHSFFAIKRKPRCPKKKQGRAAKNCNDGVAMVEHEEHKK